MTASTSWMLELFLSCCNQERSIAVFRNLVVFIVDQEEI